ncbi:Vitamin B12 ABC transporter [Klebsiella pneumoniae]|uniref:Vitamin B12 ABC transporter n=1 Tax=Klebsiella pneumoniae TaxID=573 RepID=A0A377V5X0_KLEPN|nr:Vitamin B12 ABC transporter [Klebsiella pneumoniae]
MRAGEQWIPPGEWLSAKGQLFIWQIRLAAKPWRCCWWGRRWRSPGRLCRRVFENPLAEPGLLGVSNGAGVGLIAAVLLGKWSLARLGARPVCHLLARC